MSTTIEQVTQLQQGLFALRAQVASQVQIAEAVQAINNLATAQVRKDTPSLIDVKGLGRPKEFSGKEEDFQQWSKKTEAFFAGMIKESEVMLEWAAEQTTEITTELINREFLPTATNQEPGVQNLEFCVVADAYSAYGSHELRGERHCCKLAEEPIGGLAEAAEEIRSYNRRKEEKPSSHDHFSGTLLSSGTPSGN